MGPGAGGGDGLREGCTPKEALMLQLADASLSVGISGSECQSSKA